MENSLLDRAIIFAAEKHKGMYRKGNKQPYVFHPLEVLNLASLITDDDEVLCAAMLHDTIEDTDTSRKEIEETFGKRVADIVDDESENKRGNQNKEATWQIRKQETIDKISNCKDIGSKIVTLCDKVANLRSFNQMILDEGDKAWNHFNQKDPKMHYWYYNSLKEALKDLDYTAVYKEYCFLIDAIFNRYI